MDMDLTSLTIKKARKLLDAGALSPVELTQAYLERIQSVDPFINSFITLLPERALVRAKEMEKEIQQGAYRGPLHGVPIAIKDIFETRGVRTTLGSKVFGDYIPKTNASVVDKLERAGAVILGKLNMHEIALGVTNVNPHFGACRNPWGRETITGGSSGGSAAALAAGFCLGALGTDTGGSIRIPASLCGIVGLKPTRGRVSLRGVVPLSWNLDHAGPMGHCVQDVAWLLQAIAGYDPADPYSVMHPVSDFSTGIEVGVNGLRIGLAVGDFISEETSEEVLLAVKEAARILKSQGAQIEEVLFEDIRAAAKANGTMVISDAAVFHRQRLIDHPDAFGQDVAQRLTTGSQVSVQAYILARRRQDLSRHAFEKRLQGFAAVLLPATPVAAPPIAGPDAVTQARLLTRFTGPFNLTGLPAIVLPGGFNRNGLPLGLQFVASPWQEQQLLRVAYAFEQATTWHTAKPDLANLA